MWLDVASMLTVTAIDIRLRDPDADAAALQPLWALGHLLIFSGLWLLFAPAPGREAAVPGESPDTVELVEHGRQNSSLSSVLIVFSLGAVFVVAALERLMPGAARRDPRPGASLSCRSALSGRRRWTA